MGRAGLRRSNTRTTLSTPPVAIVMSRYLFQSWVRSSLGAEIATGTLICGFDIPPAATGGEGVRESKMRRWESEVTAETRDG